MGGGGSANLNATQYVDDAIVINTFKDPRLKINATQYQGWGKAQESQGLPLPKRNILGQGSGKPPFEFYVIYG